MTASGAPGSPASETTDAPASGPSRRAALRSAPEAWRAARQRPVDQRHKRGSPRLVPGGKTRLAHGLGPHGLEFTRTSGDGPRLAAPDGSHLGARRPVREHVAGRDVHSPYFGRTLAQDVHAMVPRDRGNPRDGTQPVDPVAMGLVPDLDVEVLRGVLGVSMVAQDTQCQTEQLPRGRVVEPQEGARIAQRCTREPILDVVMRRGHPPCGPASRRRPAFPLPSPPLCCIRTGGCKET